MRKIISIVLAVLVGLVIVLAGIIWLQPEDFRVVRSATMSASAETVFEQVNDLHKWDAWSPWSKLDPAAKNSFDGSPAGTGAIFSWSGNDEVGEGKMTITESRPSDLVRIRLDFLKPMTSTCAVEFTFQPVEDKTVVTWSMSGQNNFVGKAFNLFMNCDKMVGGQFEQGLASLKKVAETPPQTDQTAK